MGSGDRHDARRQDVIARAAIALTSELSLPVVLQKIAELACEIADARYGALGVVGPGGRILEFVTHGISVEQRSHIGRLPQGRGILGALITDARPLRLKRIQDDPRSIGFPANHPPMTTFLGVPVAVRGRVFGNLYLTEKQGGGEFTQDDEDAVVQLAAHAAVAVENARLYHDARVGQQLLSSVNQVTAAILEGHDVDDVLRLIAAHARRLVRARIATLNTPLGEGRLVVRVADGDGADELRGQEFETEGSISGEAMMSRKPLVIEDAASDMRTHQPLVRRGDIGPALFVPLAVGSRTFGSLSVGNGIEDPPFADEEVEVIRAFAAQAAVALEHARITEELQRLALVEDRERIAKELHDDVIQSLFAEGMALQSSLSMVDDPDAMEVRISQAVDHIDRVIRDLRNYIFGLRPGTAADRQLDRSLRDLATGFQQGTQALIEVETDPEAVSRLAGRWSDIVQAAREAISNSVRHSGADHIQIRLLGRHDEVRLEVEDNGEGFDVATATGLGHGLVNLQDRAEGLGGRLAIESEKGRGTLVRITIPL